MKYTLIILSFLMIGVWYSFGFEHSDQSTSQKSRFFSLFGSDNSESKELKPEQKQKSNEIDMGCH